MLIDGLQTRGVFALHCRIEEDAIECGRLWVRDSDLLGSVVSLVQSNGAERFTVQIPDLVPFPSSDIRLNRVSV